jgi:hypothetical protein
VEALREREAVCLRAMLVKLIEVGMYWKTIKGRFGNKKSRTYLSMKYGYKWLNRVKIMRFAKVSK